VNAPVFHFGRGEMSDSAPPVDAIATISVTCTRAPVDGISVTVPFELHALPPTPGHVMRHSFEGDWDYLRYNMFIDSARTRLWGNGGTGTFALPGTLFLDDRNRVGTIAFPIYGRVDGAQPYIQSGQWLGALVTRVQYDPVCFN
jgi:spore coat protein U-like protein